MRHSYLLAVCGFLALATGIARADDAAKPKPEAAQQRKLDPDKLFDRLDKNKDGFIDKEEAPERLKQHFDQIDANKDGKISKEEFKQALSLLQQLRRGQTGKARPGQAGKRSGMALFERLDKNKDGFIDREEAPPRLKQHFDQLDTNKDGKLSKEEFQQALKFLRQGKGAKKPMKPKENAANDSKPADQKPATDAETKKPALPTFDSLDKNADGRLTRDEVKGTSLEDKFDEIDTNKDGKIDPKEYEAFVKKSGG